MALEEAVMKRMLIAVAIALIPVTVAPVLAATNTESVNAQAADTSERPKICFVFGPWKYCI